MYSFPSSSSCFLCITSIISPLHLISILLSFVHITIHLPMHKHIHALPPLLALTISAKWAVTLWYCFLEICLSVKEKKKLTHGIVLLLLFSSSPYYLFMLLKQVAMSWDTLCLLFLIEQHLQKVCSTLGSTWVNTQHSRGVSNSMDSQTHFKFPQPRAVKLYQSEKWGRFSFSLYSPVTCTQ